MTNGNSGTQSICADKTKGERTQSNGRCASLVGSAFAVLSTFFGAISSVFIKFATGAQPAQIQLVRLYVIYVVILPYVTYRKETLVPPNRTTALLLLVRGVVGSVATMAYTASVKFMPLGEAISILYTYVLIVGILACVFLKEPCGVFEVVLSLTTLAGVVLVAQPPFLFGSSGDNASDYQRGLGVAMSLTASTSFAVTYLVIRRMGPGVHFSLSLFYLSWCGLLIIVVYMVATGQGSVPCLEDVLHVLGSGVTGLLSMGFVTLALQKERAGVVTLVNTTEVIFSFAFQYAFFPQSTSLFGVVGASLIMVSAMVLTAHNLHKAAK